MARWIVAVFVFAACGDDPATPVDAPVSDAVPPDAAPAIDAPGLCQTLAANAAGEAILAAARDHLIAYANQHGGFPRSAATTTPTEACCRGPERCCSPIALDWGAAPWPDVGINVTEQSAFQFSYESLAPESATLVGWRDLDCDGHLVTTTVACTYDATRGAACTITPPAVLD